MPITINKKPANQKPKAMESMYRTGVTRLCILCSKKKLGDNLLWAPEERPPPKKAHKQIDDGGP